MKIWSDDFGEGAPIPSLFTCDGENTSPNLEWSDAPTGSKSFVLIMDDPDIPEFVKQKMGIEVFDHWLLYNIPPNVTKIGQGQSAGVPGERTMGKAGYTGPCPPDREHRYFFRLYALDTMLDLQAGATRAQVQERMTGHVLENVTLWARYDRKSKNNS